MPNYLELGYSPLGIKTLLSSTKQTPQETRNLTLPGANISDGVYIGVGGNVLKIDKNGIYLGGVAPTYEESRLYYSTTAHKLYIGGQSGFEVITSA